MNVITYIQIQRSVIKHANKKKYALNGIILDKLIMVVFLKSFVDLLVAITMIVMSNSNAKMRMQIIITHFQFLNPILKIHLILGQLPIHQFMVIKIQILRMLVHPNKTHLNRIMFLKKQVMIQIQIMTLPFNNMFHHLW